MKKTIIAFISLSILILGGITVKNTLTLKNTSNTALMLQTVTPPIFKEKLEGRVLIDVRTQDEFQDGHIEGAKNIDFRNPSFETEIAKLDKNTPYAIYCRSGNRSGQALNVLKELGFSDVIDLQGGIISWETNGNALCTNC